MKFEIGYDWYEKAELCDSQEITDIVCVEGKFWVCENRKSISGPFNSFEEACN